MAKQKIQDIVIKRGAAKTRDGVSPAYKRGKVKKPKASKGKFVFAIVALFLVLVFAAKAVDVFARAVIQITVHKETVNVDTILKSGNSADYDLSFETMELQLTEEKNMEATGVEEVSEKASGKIEIFNAFNSSSQKLVGTTRFESPDGKIYRIKNSIIVPGAKIQNGEITPQSIEATVYADEPGEEYNIGLTDFTIPGFKGGPRYEGFYARSITEMTGGFEGERPIVSNQDRISLKNSVESSISDKLLKKALLQKPEGFLFYEPAMNITFSEDRSASEIDKDNPEFILKETGKLFGVLISEKELSDILVEKYLGEKFVDKVRVSNLEILEFELIILDKEKETMTFKIKGEADFVWIIDEEELKESLIASPKALEDVFRTYPAIDHAFIIFKPSWWKFFPDNISKIEIEIVGNQ